MIPFLCQWIDRAAIRYAAAHMPQPDGRDLHLAEAKALLKNLDLSLVDVKPASLNFHGGTKFTFASPRPGAYPVNNVVPGHFYRCNDHWRENPVVLLLHGWNDKLDHHFFFPRHARQLNAMGISAMTIQLPLQFNRRARELGAWGNFLCADLLHTVEATFQAMSEIRAVVSWLSNEGCPFVSLWGVSMGAWLAGLTVCHDSSIGAAVLTVPVARLDRLIQEVAFCETVRGVLKERPVNFDMLNLVSNRPIIDPENILLIEAEYDLFVDKETVEELWRAWDKPEIWRIRQGHISVLGERGLARRVMQWIQAKAQARAVR